MRDVFERPPVVSMCQFNNSVRYRMGPTRARPPDAATAAPRRKTGLKQFVTGSVILE